MTTTTVRPTYLAASTSFSAWERNNGSVSNSSLVGALNDDSTSTYIFPYDYQNHSFMPLGTVTTSASQRILRARIRAKARAGSAPVQYINLSLVKTDGPETAQSRFTPTLGASWQDFTGGWLTTDAEGAEWTAANFNANYRLFLASNEDSADFASLDLAELYVDVDINTQPQVTGVSASGTDTTRPTFDWGYVDTDSDPQTTVAIKVFTAAQYGAAGFDPETSTPVWSYAPSSYTGSSKQTATDLLSATTYRAYVKGAQDFNGSAWYSSWNYVEFTMGTFGPVYYTPNTPTLLRTVDEDRARVFLEAEGRVNMLDADTASLDTATGTWNTSGTNCTVARVTTPTPAFGTGIMRMTASSAATMSTTHTTVTGITAGEDYAASAVFRTAVTARSVRVKIDWLTAASSLISTTTGSSVSDSTGAWTTATATGTAPATAARARVLVEVLSPANTEQHYVDTIGLWPGSGGTWGPGGQLGDVETLVEYQDAYGPNYLAANIADGTDTLEDLTGWSTSDADDGLVSTLEASWNGTRAVRWAPSDAASQLDLGLATGATDFSAAPLAASNANMLASVYVRAVTGTFSTKLRLAALDVDGASTGSDAVSDTLVATTTWQRVTTPALAVPDDGVYVRLSLENTGATTSGRLLVDAPLLEVTDSTTADTWVPGTGDRTDWLTVRGGEIDLEAAENQEATLYDYESPRGDGIRLYQATNVFDDDTNTASSDPVAATAFMEPDGTWWLKDVLNPVNNTSVRVLREITETIAEDGETFRPLGREFPVTVSDFIGGSDGSFKVRTFTPAEWSFLLRLLRLQYALLYQPGSGGSRYIRIRQRDWNQLTTSDGTHREVTVQYVQQDRPEL